MSAVPTPDQAGPRPSRPDQHTGRTGYLALFLPQQTAATDVPDLLRRRLSEALAASGEVLARWEIVTSDRSRSAPTKRWFVEYQTYPPCAERSS
jgi:hypothetical protein